MLEVNHVLLVSACSLNCRPSHRFTWICMTESMEGGGRGGNSDVRAEKFKEMIAF